ncbi:MAG: division/cell wall cluster transcriptional repressor MraZ [Proteobacteria bacterium]|nr:division/cell wall cluster transcriptional repressor MraZ [Pseudomonadota bacterium]
MFAGRFEYAIDDKSRVSIPSKFREVLSTNYDMRLILTNLDGCIVAYPYQEWVNIQERISNLGTLKKEARVFLRFYYSGVSECSIDKLGRVLIPQSLKNYANIKKNVAIIGMNRKIEIWAQETWEELVKKATSDLEQMVDIVSELGL